MDRSSRPEVFLEKDVFCKYPANLQENRICRSTMKKNFIEITLQHGCSPVNLLHIFRTPFPKNTSGRLLLNGKFYTQLIFCYKKLQNEVAMTDGVKCQTALYLYV